MISAEMVCLFCCPKNKFKYFLKLTFYCKNFATHLFEIDLIMAGCFFKSVNLPRGGYLLDGNILWT